MNGEIILKVEESLNNIKNRGAFLTGGNKYESNIMSISWANIGYMWWKKICVIAISDIRYTKEFIDKYNTFTLSIPFNNSKDKQIDFCGHNSGRHVDKIKESNIKLVPGKTIETPVIYGCNMYYECKVILKQNVDISKTDMELEVEDNEKELTIYFGEIVEQYYIED